MTDYDHPYKRLFSYPIMIADLIVGFLDADLVEVCDISSLERCNGSYVTDDLREREDDLWVVEMRKMGFFLGPLIRNYLLIPLGEMRVGGTF